MNIGLIVLIAYFSLGLLTLLILAKNIQSNIKSASVEAQVRLAASGNVVGARTSALLIIASSWVLWPAVIYGALRKREE